ncbi:MAG: dTDP-4-dehydrorhamnose reductase [Salinivirgaceae bacterium]|nr:dTDP-4-dehydrorhamnose reductase [Salinivirgaceae bacterium]
MRILVTGANGQLGKELQFFRNQYPDFQFVFTDVDDLDITKSGEAEAYTEQNPVDFIINCAAYTAVDKAEEDRDNAFLVNTVAVDYLVDAAAKCDACLIHISTDYVFDGTKHTPYDEEDVAIPESMYGDTKYEGEKLVLYSDINALIIRTSWLYSGFGNNFVKTMLRLGKERDELNVIFDQIGSPTYARDLAKSILEIISKIKLDKENPTQEIYHYTNEGVASWYDFACEIFRQEKIECNVKSVDSSMFPTPAKRPHFSVLNKSKIKKDFDITIPHWVDSLREMLKVLKEE